MKSIYFLIFVFCLHLSSAFPQSGWQPQVSGTTAFLSSVHFTSSSTGWIAGYGGTILMTTNGGDIWTAQISGTATDLISVHFPNSSTGYACGSNGIILKTTNGGVNWIVQNSGTTEQLNSIYFPNASVGFTVGTNGTILRTGNGGLNWVSRVSGTADYLFSTHFTSTSTGWSVGGSPFTENIIIKTTNSGTNWFFQTAPAQGLLSVHFISPTTGCAVGSFGRVVYTSDGGLNWEDRTYFPGLYGELRSVHMMSESTGFLTKSNKIYKSTAYADSWMIQEVSNTNLLNDLYLTSLSTGWAVGYNGTILKTTNGGTSTFTFNVTVIPEGLYNLNSGSVRSDTITVTPVVVAPYPLGVYPAKGILDSAGNCSVKFYDADNTTPIYFVITHRNSIETFAASTLNFTSFGLTYDFTTSSSQAYGSNQILLGTEYCIYSGDINQDGEVNNSDEVTVSNDASNFLAGYVQSDISNDNFVDGSDAAIVSNNAYNHVISIGPYGFASGPKDKQFQRFKDYK